MTDPNGWPDPQRPGAPANPDKDEWHWLVSRHDDRAVVAVRWRASFNAYDFPHTWRSAETARSGWRYLGPCHTPAEVAALVAAARREGMLAAAAWHRARAIALQGATLYAAADEHDGHAARLRAIAKEIKP